MRVCDAVPEDNEALPYMHEDITAEPDTHEEIPAEAYVHEEPVETHNIPAEAYMHEEVEADVHQEPAPAPVVSHADYPYTWPPRPPPAPRFGE